MKSFFLKKKDFADRYRILDISGIQQAAVYATDDLVMVFQQ